jgi:hypothetical protein
LMLSEAAPPGVERVGDGQDSDSAAAGLVELNADACDLEDAAVGAVGRRCPALRLLSLAACDKLSTASAHYIAAGCTQVNRAGQQHSIIALVVCLSWQQ